MLTRRGGQDQRALLYLVRRHLGFKPSEWDGLAWWEQRLYIEGLEKEFSQQSENSADDGLIFSGRPGEMSRVGFTEFDLS